MTVSRRMVYRRSWHRRECKNDIKKRRREYHKRMRRSNDPAHTRHSFVWQTVS